MRSLYTKYLVLGLWCAFLSIFLLQPINLSTADIGRHIVNGRIFLESDSATRTALWQSNFYSYTMPQASFVNHHWGSGVIFYLIYKLSGFAGLSIFYWLISLATILLFFNLAKRFSNFYTALVVGLCLTPLLVYRVEVRPEVWSYFLSGVFFNLIYYRKYLWSLSLLMLIWINLHIGFVFGFLILGAWLLEELVKYWRKQGSEWRRVASILAGSLVASLVNPFGYKLLIYPLQIFSNYGYRVVENQSVMFLEGIDFTNNMHFGLFKLALALVVVGAGVLIYKRALPLHLALSGVVVGVMALFGIRNFEIFGLFASIIISSTLACIFFSKIQADTRALLLIVLSAGAIISQFTNFLFAYQNWGVGLQSGQLGSAQFFAEHKLVGPIFNNYDIGGYLIFNLYPQERVYVDNRPEAYSEKFFSTQYREPQESEEAWRALD